MSDPSIKFETKKIKMRIALIILLLIIPSITWTQPTTNDYQILKINNFAGLAGKNNAITITFPDILSCSKVVFSYKALNKEVRYDSIDFKTYQNDYRNSDNFIFDETPSKTKLRAYASEKTVKIYLDNLGGNQFDLGDLKQPKKANIWLLKELIIYSTEKPSWFNSKEYFNYPELTIENLLLGYREKGIWPKKIGFNDGIAPKLILNDFSNAASIKIIRPVEAENCGTIGITCNGNIQKDKELGKIIALEDGQKSLRIDFFNSDAYYQKKKSTCTPKIELVFAVPEKVIPLEQLPLEVFECDSTYVRNSKGQKTNRQIPKPYNKNITVTQPFSLDESNITACSCGTRGGNALFKFTPLIVKIEKYHKCKQRIEGINTLYDTINIDIPISEIEDTTNYSVQIKEKVGLGRQSDTSYTKTDSMIITSSTIDSFLYTSITPFNNNTVFVRSANRFKDGLTPKSYFLQIISKEDNKIVHTEPFIIDKGGKCAEPFIIAEKTPINNKCLSTVKQEDKRLPCQTEIISISKKEADGKRFLVVSLDSERLANLEDADIISFGFDNQLLKFKNDKAKKDIKTNKTLACGTCEAYKNNDIVWNYNYKAINQYSRSKYINDFIQPLVFDLDKIGNNEKIYFKLNKSKNDEPVNLHYQFISVVSTNP